MPEAKDVGQDVPCRLCAGARWLCKQHPNRPWPHDDCSGPGEPCDLCNGGEPPERIYIDDLDDPNGNIH